MRWRLVAALFIGLALLLVGPAFATGPSERKQQVDQRLSDLQDRIAQARARSQGLSAEVDSITTEIRALEQRIGDVSARLAPLERDLALHRERLSRLSELFRLQTRQLLFLRRQYRLAVRRLERRVVAIYETGEVETLDIVFSSASFSDLVDQFEYSRRIEAQDARIAAEVGRARDNIGALRAHTRATRRRVAGVTRTIEVRTSQVRALRDSLVSRQGALASARAGKQQTASQVQVSLREMLSESESLQQVSTDLAAKLRAVQAATPSERSTQSSSGLIWPVDGPVTSPFGYRCLEGVCRMHEGIDIGVGYGTPIHAAASGVVVFAGWEGGYGNLILIDHGGGLATAYAHQSGFAVGGGAQVSQGEVIGYVGCTGHCFGAHLHFEVRVNGTAVDPLGYL